MPSQQRDSSWPALAIAATVLAFALSYAKCVTIQPAGDDWLLIYPVHQLVREHGIAGALTGIFKVAIGDFYRPLALLPFVSGSDSYEFLQIIKLAAALGLFALVVNTARLAGLSPLASRLVGAVTVLHQTFTSVITELDLWGDLINAIAVVALVNLHIRFVRRMISKASFLLSAGLITLACMLAKEAGVMCFAIPLTFLLLRPLPVVSDVRRTLVKALILLGALVVGYLGLRVLLGVGNGPRDGYYSLTLGSHIIKNIGLAVAALLSPIETPKVALDGFLWQGLAIGWVVVLGVWWAIGSLDRYRKQQWRLPLTFIVLFIAVQGPVLLMPHLTEANFTRSLAFGWLAFALAVKPLFERLGRTVKTAAVIVMVTWLVFDLWSVNNKSADIIIGQNRAARFRTTLKMMYPELGPRLTFAVLNPGYQGYSVYSQPLLIDLRDGEVPFGIRELYHNDSLDVQYDTVATLQEADSKGAAFLLQDDGTILATSKTPVRICN